MILAKTVKGWTLGRGVEARNITHQAKKLNEDELRVFRDRLELPIPDAKLKEAPYFHPGPGVRGGAVHARAARGARRARAAARRPREAAAGADRRTSTRSSTAGSTTAVSTTMVFTRLLRNLIREPELGPRIVPIIPDEARTFGMDPLFKEVGIYAAHGQRYEPVDSDLVLSYREATDGQVLEEGINEAGSMASFQAAGHVVRDPRRADDPVLHLLLDVRVPADRRPGVGLRRPARARVHDGRHGGPDDARRRGAPARRRPHAGARLDRARHPGLRPGVRVRARDDRARRRHPHVPRRRGRLLLRHGLQRELRPAAEARGRRRGDREGPLPVRAGARARATRRAGCGSWAPGRSSSRSSRRATSWPRSSASPPRCTRRPRSSSCATRRSRSERWNRLHPDEDAARPVRDPGPGPRRRAR